MFTCPRSLTRPSAPDPRRGTTKRRPLGLVIVATLGLAASAAAVAQSGMEVRAAGGRGWEVEFRNECVVRFDGDGRELRHSDRCTREQRQRAREAVADRRGDGSDANRRPGRGDDEPRVVIGSNGYGHVDVGRDCRVLYDRRGQRQDSPHGCSRDDLRRADAAMDAHRRQAGSSRPHDGEHDRQGVMMRDGGGGEVRIGSQCTVTYDRNGRRDGTDGRCSSGDLKEADNRFRRRHAQQELIRQQGQGN